MHFSVLALAAICASLVTSVPTTLDKRTTRTYETVTGYFLQDDPETDPSTFDPQTSNFGLLPTFTWSTFARKVASLNSAAPSDTTYKVLFLGRHGEGWHNVAETYYGTIAWYAYWCEKDGNGTVTWADAHLTSNGIEQAKKLSATWANQIKEKGTPPPQSYYTSPLDRTCATANFTFGGLELPEDRKFVPIVKENLRETLGVATSDRRSTKTYIHNEFPSYPFEAGFTENDELWSSWRLELPPEQDKRLKGLLDDVFGSDDNTWISMTSHSVSITSMLRVLGHRAFNLETAGMLPVLVKSVAS